MTKLSDSLKRALSGLAYQDAGEFLPMHEKMKMLGMTQEAKGMRASSAPSATRKPAIHRIALISDGRGEGAPIEYVIEACLRQNARIDLLTHGTVDTARISSLENQIRAAGLDYHRIQLGVNPIDDIVNYINNYPALDFLVAMPDDEVAKVLIEEEIPKRGGRICVPLVLIEDRSLRPSVKQSAA